ncbi:MAG: M56 family metallopeptidase, partial [Lachnospiraceae bacterium]|nr:M56 family metallopeptidase [Lachnospiraceae bacterium]
MSLLQMSFSGAVLILVVIIIRILAINRLPKMTFLILWGIVLFRLLIPFSISSAFSVYSLIDQNAKIDTLKQISTEQVITEDAITSSALPKNNQQLNHIAHAEHNEKRQSDSGVIYKTDNGSILKKLPQRGFVNWSIIWFIGMAVCITYFAVSYLRCRFEFQISLPVEDEFSQDFVKDCSYHYMVSVFTVENTFVQKWPQKHSRWRQVSIRQSDRITTPLTYGIFHPVILMPKTTDWENTEQMQYVLMHEYVHICRYDALTKLIVISALCIHWFNPIVWIMYVLFNRDVEISCDESVVRHMGEASKSTYARMLIQMEAARSGLAPFCNGLLPKISKNAMEERITAIMKIKKKSIFAGIAAAILIISVTAAFATSATKTTEASEAKKPTKTTETAKTSDESTTSILDMDFTKQEYEKLLALRFDDYENMSISEFQDKVWALTDTEEYMNLLERFFADETLYTMYECGKGADSNEISSFLYNVLAPLMVDTQQPPRGFAGYAVSDFSGASDNASLEYVVTLTILDANLLTVWEYDWARQRVMEDLGNILKELTTSDLRDKEWMTGYIDEEIESIKSMYGNSALQIAVDYAYTPLGVMAVDDMEIWQQERRDEWDRMMAPYTPFGLTYRYDWDTDDYKMYFQGKEVRGIYDEGKNLWISEHAGIGKGIYDENAIELFAVYENKKLVG